MLRSVCRAVYLSATALLLGVVPALGAGPTAEVVHSFANQAGGSSFPLIEASGGRLVGVSDRGGVAGRGEIFLLTPDGGGGFEYSTVHAFIDPADGWSPNGAVARGEDGLLYGTTALGGSENDGIAFRTDEAGAFEILASFASDSCGRLMLADDGNFYGAGEGGSFGWGTVCRMDTTGTVTVLKSFTEFEGVVADTLAQGSDGALYGCLRLGGIHAYPGRVFRITTDGDYSVLHDFTGGVDGENPAGLALAGDGNLYGTTPGTIFRIDGGGAFSTVYAFAGLNGGSQAPLTGGADGKLYGMTEGFIFPGLLFRYDPVGAYETLASFGSVEFVVSAAMIQADDGDFYGVTQNGGSALVGTVFRSDLSSVEPIYSFQATGGFAPVGRLLEASDGLLYGVTPEGGTSGGGTAFRLDLSGTFETFHPFADGEGNYPSYGPVESEGQLFGTTLYGGPGGNGTFFRLNADGTATVLQDFVEDPFMAPRELIRASDGNLYGVAGTSIVRLDTLGSMEVIAPLLPFVPERGLSEGPDGALYGAMRAGGSHAAGTIFRVALDGSYSAIHEFSGLDGSDPNGGLLLRNDGYLWGTTLFGGPNLGWGNKGTVFRVNPAGDFETVYVFGGWNEGDGDYCNGYLFEASDGYVYGTTAGAAAGGFGGGTVFRLDAAGNQSVVHAFGETSDASSPRHGLIQASDGLLYGTTAEGGGPNYTYGAVYRIDPSTIVPVTAISPDSGPAGGGTAVTVTGQQFQDGAGLRIGTLLSEDPIVASDTEIMGTTPIVMPGTLNHVSVLNPDGSEGSLGRAFFADFFDVPASDIFHEAVEKIFRGGITAGCGLGDYCRNSSTTRAQMAVFLLRSLLGRFYNPPPATGAVFSDVSAVSFAAAFIEDLAARGITAGCGDHMYCPNGSVTRAQMAVFLLKTLLGTSHTPPPAIGVFGDVPVGSFAADWIEDLYARGITSGCSSTELLYCPSADVTRGQMAAFLVATFNLP